MKIIASEKTKFITDYYFATKLREIEQINKNNEIKVINMAIGNPDLMPHEYVKNTINETINQAKSFMYGSYKGSDKYRQTIADWYKKNYQVEICPDTEILPLIGSKEGIAFISLAYLNLGDSVLIPNPSYPAYTSAALIAQAKVVNYDLENSNNWYPEMYKLDKLLDEKPKLIWINYPNMPTGSDFCFEKLSKLVEWAYTNNIIICNDNPYSHILNENPQSIFSIPLAKECCLELNSLSKTYNMAGCRIGMLIGKSELINPVFKILSNFSSGSFSPLHHAAIEAMKLSKEWTYKMNSIYKQRKAMINALLDSLKCTYSTESTGMFVWAKIPENFSNGDQFCNYILENSKVFICPGFIFGNNGDKYIRISLCVDEKQIIEAKQRINHLNI
jgi:LL-diaminopimelate aminotransferase